MAARALIAIAVLGLCGCVALGPDGELPGEPARVVDEQMNTSVRVYGPVEQEAVGGVLVKSGLVAVLPRSGKGMEVYLSLRLFHRTGGWFFPRSATYLQADGNAVEAVGFEAYTGQVSDCGSLGCLYAEGGAITVPMAQVEAWQSKGRASPQLPLFWRARLSGQTSYIDARLDARKIEQFTALLARETAKLPAQQ